MPIRKRLTEKERIKRQLPKGWSRAIKHPLVAKLCYNGVPFDPTPKNIVRAISQTKSWKGASWTEKVFVQALDLIMEKAFGVGILEPEAYNRLQDHLINNDTKIQVADFRTWHVWLWDIYHDGYKLQDMETGDLELPSPAKLIKKSKRKPTIKRRKVVKPK